MEKVKKCQKNVKKYVSKHEIKIALKLDSGTILGLFFTYTTSWDTGKNFLKNWKKSRMPIFSTFFRKFLKMFVLNSYLACLVIKRLCWAKRFFKKTRIVRFCWALRLCWAFCLCWALRCLLMGARDRGPGPGTRDPGTQDPGTQGPRDQGPRDQGPGTQGPRDQGPGTQGPRDPGTGDPGTQGPGTQGPLGAG